MKRITFFPAKSRTKPFNSSISLAISAIFVSLDFRNASLVAVIPLPNSLTRPGFFFYKILLTTSSLMLLAADVESI